MTGATKLVRDAANEMLAAQIQWRIDPEHILALCDAVEALTASASEPTAFDPMNGGCPHCTWLDTNLGRVLDKKCELHQRIEDMQSDNLLARRVQSETSKMLSAVCEAIDAGDEDDPIQVAQIRMDELRAADQIIGEIEQRFPDWRGFRDLVDCIDVTLHNLRSASPVPASEPATDRLYDADQNMADGEIRMTAAEDVLGWLLIEKIGVPDDCNYTPNQAQEIIASRLDAIAAYENAALANPVPTPDGAVAAVARVINANEYGLADGEPDEAPDRIRVAQDADGFWTCREAVSGSQEYVRADLVPAAHSPADGWRLVPVEPTTAMLQAAGECASRMREVNGGACGADYYRAMIAAAHPADGWRATHRHVKRGTEYALLGIGKMQAERWFDLLTHNGVLEAKTSVDMREVAIYRSLDDRSLWARPREEFEDGRFEALPAKPEGE